MKIFDGESLPRWVEWVRISRWQRPPSSGSIFCIPIPHSYIHQKICKVTFLIFRKVIFSREFRNFTWQPASIWWIWSSPPRRIGPVQRTRRIAWKTRKRTSSWLQRRPRSCKSRWLLWRNHLLKMIVFTNLLKNRLKIGLKKSVLWVFKKKKKPFSAAILKSVSQSGSSSLLSSVLALWSLIRSQIWFNSSRRNSFRTALKNHSLSRRKEDDELSGNFRNFLSLTNDRHHRDCFRNRLQFGFLE